MVGASAVVTVLVSLLTLGPVRPLGAQGPIAVIVHPSNPLQSISRDQLQRLFLGRRTTLPDGRPVTLVESAESREPFYAAALNMSTDRFKRHWIAMVFAGESGFPPREIGGPAELVRFVASHPNAIAFVAAGALDSSVKILAIEGLRPGDRRYLLREDLP